MDGLDCMMLHSRKPEPEPEDGRNEDMDGDYLGGAVAGGGGKRKRRRGRPSSSSPSFNRVSFPLMLASIANLHNPRARSLIKRLLRAHLAVISTPLPLSRLVPSGLLALLPSLLA
ncbi:hypothetical protein J5N97_003471 [Dioscorea zingiberensis]|uniref:Uncharacterized protein n=1 Tax=Dioscorea zingiberensis TaxID=325984 RepID=A0A9D5D476_9LILI|nr:hypothetical protein J5N97_003471 [Dioscorea zingiberensis]